MPSLPEPYPHTIAQIYAAYEASRQDTERTYLGLSTFGTKCDRALWYGFRWVSPPEVFDGRKLRLFATGHREEERLVADLRAAGLEVEDRGPDGSQWAVSALGGHLRGHLDGKVTGVPEARATPHVLECKTHSEKNFKSLKKQGVRLAFPGHFLQMTGYMHLEGLKRALYVAHNKNTDELHVERVEYDPVEAAKLMARAERIVHSPVPLPKIHKNPKAKAAWLCRLCPHLTICHYGGWARLNCRTCLSATPIDGGWWCEFHGRTLQIEDQRIGCSSHLFIPQLVPGEQIDYDEAERTVTYRRPDKSIWTDGEQENV